MAVAGLARGRTCGGLIFDAGPGEVHVEEEEKNAHADDEGLSSISARVWADGTLGVSYVELVMLSHEGVIKKMPIDLARVSPRRRRPRGHRHTCGLINTRSMNKTTKSCSTYLSQKRPQFLHTVSRTPWPLDRSSARVYSV